MDESINIINSYLYLVRYGWSSNDKQTIELQNKFVIKIIFWFVHMYLNQLVQNLFKIQCSFVAGKFKAIFRLKRENSQELGLELWCSGEVSRFKVQYHFLSVLVWALVVNLNCRVSKWKLWAILRLLFLFLQLYLTRHSFLTHKVI